MTDRKAKPTNDSADERLKKVICQTTGHRVDDLEPEQFLEADLGLDSIKTVQILSQLLTTLPEESRERIGKQEALKAVLAAETLGDLLTLYRTWFVPAEEPETSIASVAAASGLDVAVVQSAETVPLVIAQIPLLVAHLAVSTCSLVTAVSITGRLNVEALETAYDAVVKRHPLLRANVRVPPGTSTLDSWMLEIHSHAQVRVELLELDGLMPERRNDFLDDYKREALSHVWKLNEGPLHRLTLARLGPDCGEIILTNHHLIADGLSVHVIIEELLQTYQTLLFGKSLVGVRPYTVEEYRRLAQELNVWENEQEDRALDRLRRARPSPMRSHTAVSAARSDGFAVPRFHRLRLTTFELQRLNEVVRALDVSLNSIVVAALSEAERERVGAPEAYTINVPTGGRNRVGSDLSDWVGCFAQNVAMTFPSRPRGQGWSERLLFLHGEIQRAVENGCDRAETRAAARAALASLNAVDGNLDETMCSIVRAGMHVDRYLSFVGRIALQRDYGAFVVSDYLAATTTNAGTMDCLVELVFDELRITVNYDSQSYSSEELADFGERLLACLREIADSAGEAPARRLVPNPPEARGALTDVGATSARAVLSAISRIRRVETTQNEIDAHLGADLGIDSLRRVRLAVALAQSFPSAQKRQLVECRTPRELIRAVEDHPRGDEEVQAIPYRGFVRAALEWPTNVAVKTEKASLTYRELEKLSRSLGAELQRRGVARGIPVGLLCQPGPELIVGMLAILRAGGAYVPLDPEYPIARLKTITGHAGVTLLVTHSAVSADTVEELVSAGGIRCAVAADLATSSATESARAGIRKHGGVEVVDAATWLASESELKAVDQSPDDPMVLLYTSGSTGAPKGVELAHRGYANRFEWHQEQFGVGTGDRVAQRTSCCFDVSVWELLWPLLHGATVCPVARSVTRNPWALAEWIESMAIRVMHFVPSLFSEFVRAIEGEPFTFKSLRWLIFSGEALPPAPVREFRGRYGDHIRMANLYGPTEASIDVTVHVIDGAPSGASIPIGRAMPGCRILVLREDGSVCQKGEVGQIWLGGVQLAKGYWRNPEATAGAFRRLNVPGEGETLLYRTGDLGVELTNGEFDYRGRLDGQVKVRGFRVELGEIESVLTECDGVSECAVLAVDSNESEVELVAFVAARSGGVTSEQLRSSLSRRLPIYMVPHRFVVQDRLPLNPNGKLDRNALRAKTGLTSHREPLEARRDDAAIQAVSRGRPEPRGAEQVHEAASRVRDGNGARVPIQPRSLGNEPRVPEDASGDEHATERRLPIGPAQSWLFSYFAAPYGWCGFTQFEYRQDLDWQAFERALETLMLRHDALRTYFVKQDDGWTEVVRHSFPIGEAVSYVDRRGIDEGACKRELATLVREGIRRLSIEHCPLWRVIVMRLEEMRFAIAVVGHHLISDMLSNEILFRDMWQIYAAILSGSPCAATLPAQYGDLVRAVEEERRSGRLKNHVDYYLRQFPSREYAFAVPFDHRTGPNTESSSASERVVLTHGAKTLEDARKRSRCGSYALLAAGVYAALSEWTGSKWVVVSHRSHGRDLGDGRCFPDAVGNFAVNYPLGVEIEKSDSADRAIAKIAEKLQSIPMKGVTYDAIAEDLPGYLYPDNALTPVRLNYLGARDLPVNEVFAFDGETRDKRYLPEESPRTALIEIFLTMERGDLIVELNYSKNFHRAETMRRLGESLCDRVGALARQVSADHTKSARPTMDADSVRRADVRGPKSPVAIVTGAGRGIGRSIALALAEAGMDVVVTSRTEQNVRQVADEVRQRGRRALGITSDVTNMGDVKRVVAEALGEFGRIDVLVNNAGTTMMASLEEASPSEWKRIVDVNLFGTYHFCREVVPILRRQRSGKIINIGSDSSVIGYPCFGAYAASKHAVLGLTKSLAEELKQEGIQVNVVCPALVDTDMAPASLRSVAIAPEAIAEVVAFLASPESRAITGEAIRAYGTQDIHWFGSRQAQRLGMIGATSLPHRTSVLSGIVEAE